MLKRLKNIKFWREERGVSAIEFAFIFPVLILLLFGSAEIGQILLIDRKLVSATSATADLVAQVRTVSTADVADIFRAGSAVMHPFGLSGLSLVITSVEADAGGITSVAWSDGMGAAAPLAVGSAYTLPPGLVAANQSVIMVQSRYSYASPFGKILIGPITLTDEFFLSPRRSAKVARIP